VDVFASGILLYELLTKQKPFPRATDVESLIASRKARVVPPSTLDDRLPRELDAIVARAIAYEPEDRYPDARSFAQALVDVLFPTPHSAVQESLADLAKGLFADRIAKGRAARAHDALVMKVLANTLRAEASPEGPLLEDPLPELAVPAPRSVRARAGPPPRRPPVERGVSPRRAAALALAAALAGSGATLAALRALALIGR
jgi:hypothetical protein